MNRLIIFFVKRLTNSPLLLQIHRFNVVGRPIGRPIGRPLDVGQKQYKSTCDVQKDDDIA